MANNNLDLVNLFSQVTSVLADNQKTLNKADGHNHDHGDHMVDIFKVITQAMEQKQNSSAADQLEYAAELLRSQESGSANLYSRGLAQAAQQFQGKEVTPGNAIHLVQSLLGGGQAAPEQAETGSPLASLLSGLGAGKGNGEADEGIDAGDLLNAGLAFLSAKERGDSNVEALVDAVVSSSAMSDTEHRVQSSQLVINSLMDAIGSMNN